MNDIRKRLDERLGELDSIVPQLKPDGWVTGEAIFRAIAKAIGKPNRVVYWSEMVRDGSASEYVGIAEEINWFAVREAGKDAVYFDYSTEPNCYAVIQSNRGEIVVRVTYAFRTIQRNPVSVQVQVLPLLLELGDKYEPSPMEQFALVFSSTLADHARRQRKEANEHE